MNRIAANLINSILAGTLVFLGALTDGKITLEGCIASLVAGGIVAVVQFKEFWTKAELTPRQKAKKKLCNPAILNFINL